MATNTVNEIARTEIARTNVSLDSDKTAVDREEIKRLAQQFEAMLMTQMVREMRRSMLDEDEQGDGLGAGVLGDNADIEFGLAMSRTGGLGLTTQLLSKFEEQAGSVRHAAAAVMNSAALDSGLAPANAGAHDRSVQPWSPASAGPDTELLDGQAPVSSGFGWRRDPFSGAAQFHKGVDLAVAYGHEVKASAAGRVAFAGVQGSYGQTVLIDHGNGRQTRYAHLSDALVRTGERVEEGQVVARSGSSGRSTGPHLHIERLVDGVAVDPLGTEL